MDERPYQAGPSSGHDRNSPNINKPSGAGVSVIETPMGLRKIMERDGRDLSGFREEKGTMRRVTSVEREMGNMGELIAGILLKQDELVEENKELRNKFMECEKDLQLNKEMKREMEALKEENERLKTKFSNYEQAIQGLEEKFQSTVEREGASVTETKLEEIKDAWKKQHEEKVSFAEVIRRQVQENTKSTVIQVIKEKDELVRDAVDKKRCIVIFGLKEKKNSVKFVRD